MIMLGDKKRIAQIIVGEYGSENAESFAERASEPDQDALTLACAELLKAIKASDVIAMRDAFSAAFAACESYEDEGELPEGLE